MATIITTTTLVTLLPSTPAILFYSSAKSRLWLSHLSEEHLLFFVIHSKCLSLPCLLPVTDITTRSGFIRKTWEEGVGNQLTEEIPHDQPSYVICVTYHQQMIGDFPPTREGQQCRRQKSLCRHQAVVQAGPGAGDQGGEHFLWWDA